MSSIAMSSGAAVTGSVVIIALTGRHVSSPAASTRVRRSRSVTMPTRRSLSTTSSEETCCRAISSRCLADRRVAGRRDRLAPEEVTEPRLEHGVPPVVVRQRLQRVTEAGLALLGEEVPNRRMPVRQRLEDVGRHDEQQAVLDGHHVEAGRPAAQSGRAETGALAAACHE